MKNSFGYKDQQEVVVTPQTPLGEQTSAEELRDKYIKGLPEESTPIDI
jgi:hypothetical protein